MKKLILSSTILTALLFIASCGESGKKESVVSSTDSSKIDSTKADSAQAKYVCPMHSEVISDHPDTCSICGMDLEKVN